MRVFISWSGARSKAFAESLKDWLPDVIQSVEPWLSVDDVEKGKRWETEIANALDSADFAVICLTADTLRSPWLIFEAGAMSRRVPKQPETPIATLLLDIPNPGAVEPPLAQFNATTADKEDVFRLIKTINDAAGDSGVGDAGRLRRQFDKEWKRLEEAFANVVSTPIAEHGRSADKLDPHAPEPSPGSQRRTFPDPIEMYPFLLECCDNCDIEERTVDVLGLTLASTWSSLKFWIRREDVRNWRIRLTGFVGATEEVSDEWAPETVASFRSIKETGARDDVRERNVTLETYGYTFAPAVHGFRLPNGDLFIAVTTREAHEISRQECPYEYVPGDERSTSADALRRLFESWFAAAISSPPFES